MFAPVEHAGRVVHNGALVEGFGDQVRSARAARRWTQDDLARESGVSKRTIVNVESGSSPNMDTFLRLTRTLGLSESFSVVAPATIRDAPAPAEPQPADHFRIIDFYAGMTSVPLKAEVALGEPMDYSVEGETVMIPTDQAPDPAKFEYLIRGRGDSMVDFGIEDGDYVVVEARPGGVAATGELVIAWYEPADRAIPGGITLKRWIRRGGKKILQGSTEQDTFELREGDIFELKGIVRRAIKVKHFPKISG